MTENFSAPAPIPRRFAVLALLFVVYTFNFIDRQIVAILARPIQADLGLTNTELGLMGGTAFALFYTALGVPIAWLADRSSRAWIVTVALALWSGFTAACGLAQNFWQLFLARVGVGVGEAGGVAPSYSLISDYFPPRERARAMAAFSFGIPVGSAAGVLVGGILAAQIDWRIAFVAVGVAGVLIAPVFRAVVREPARGQFDPQPAEPAARASIADVVRTLGPKPSFWLLSFGAAAASIMGYGVFFWMPSFIAGAFGFNLVQTSWYFAALLLVGGVLGIWGGGALADRLGARSRAAYALIPAAAFVIAVPCYAAGLLTASPSLAFVLFVAPTALGLTWLGPIVTAVQHLATPATRATASAIFLFINNLIGIGLGALVIGAMSDWLTPRFGADALRYSIMAGACFLLVGAGLFALAAKRLGRDWTQ